jgi:hypothetical protein
MAKEAKAPTFTLDGSDPQHREALTDLAARLVIAGRSADQVRTTIAECERWLATQPTSAPAETVTQ